MSESESVRMHAAARVASTLLTTATIAACIFVARGASAAFRNSDRWPVEPTSSVLAYEGVAAIERGLTGVQTELTECTASVIDLPGVGPRVVTARHCDGGAPRVFDARSEVRPIARREQPGGGPDVAVLDLPKGTAWQALPTRASSTLREGETLCAFHAVAGPGQLDRQEVCGAFVGRTLRLDGGPSQLVISHPFVHGTSGSPLMDAQGRVVGVVSATSDDEGFAEPIEEATRAALSPPIAMTGGSTVRRHGAFWPFSDDKPRVGSLCVFSACVRWQLGS